jgi:hypothetical protein
MATFRDFRNGTLPVTKISGIGTLENRAVRA